MTLQTTGIKTLEQVRVFVDGNQAVSFVLNDRPSANRWLMETLKRFRYGHCSKIDKGLLRAYVCKITGLSRTQFTCLIAQYFRDGRIEDRRKAPAKPFATRYTPDDIPLLAETDILHSTLTGSVLCGLCERMLKVLGDQRFEQLAGISNGHL